MCKLIRVQLVLCIQFSPYWALTSCDFSILFDLLKRLIVRSFAVVDADPCPERFGTSCYLVDCS